MAASQSLRRFAISSARPAGGPGHLPVAPNVLTHEHSDPGAASAALVGFGTWLGLILFGAFLLPLAANALFPPNTAGTANDFFASTTAQQMFLRISPATLYRA